MLMFDCKIIYYIYINEILLVLLNSKILIY